MFASCCCPYMALTPKNAMGVLLIQLPWFAHSFIWTREGERKYAVRYSGRNLTHQGFRGSVILSANTFHRFWCELLFFWVMTLEVVRLFMFALTWLDFWISFHSVFVKPCGGIACSFLQKLKSMHLADTFSRSKYCNFGAQSNVPVSYSAQAKPPTGK